MSLQVSKLLGKGPLLHFLSKQLYEQGLSQCLVIAERTRQKPEAQLWSFGPQFPKDVHNRMEKVNL